ncbi:hypothetical protein D3C77_794230 [compost metagenome]
MLGAQALVLLAVNEPLRLTGRPLVVIQAQLADHPLDQALLIIGIEDLEILRQTSFLPMGA